VLQVLRHSDLSHEAVLVAVHAGQLAHVREDVMNAIRKLEGVHIAETISGDETGRKEAIRTYCTWESSTSLVSLRISRHKWNAFPNRDFLRSLVVNVCTLENQSIHSTICANHLNRLQVEVIIQVKIIKILSVDQQVQHIVSY
jgi:hypothetical protein